MRNNLSHDRLYKGSIIAAACCSLVAILYQWRKRNKEKNCSSRSAYEKLIGNTPMIKLNRLSSLIKRNIYVKMENLNPGGTGKDRAAQRMIQQAEEEGLLPMRKSDSDFQDPLSPVIREDPLLQRALDRSTSGGLVIEGTSGSTGIALASICQSRGHGCIVVMPDDQANEKRQILETLGAVVHIVPNSSISSPEHYVNIAKALADKAKNYGIPAVFTDQFENLANYAVHRDVTGPEILHQCPHMNAFVMSAGTGGSIAGIGSFLKRKKPSCNVVLVDPPGSVLFNKIEYGVAFTNQQTEREMKRHRYDTLAEGIGLDRVTANFMEGISCIDEAIKVTDQDAVDMAHWILDQEGLWVGSSSAMNLVGAVIVAQKLPDYSHIVTIACDSGTRHLTRFWDRKFCLDWGLLWPKDAPRSPKCLASSFV